MAVNKTYKKAFVRVDGSGRVIPTSMVLRVNMPKVGKWRQIQKDECCDPLLTTSTTTVAITTTTTTP